MRESPDLLKIDLENFDDFLLLVEVLIDAFELAEVLGLFTTGCLQGSLD